MNYIPIDITQIEENEGHLLEIQGKIITENNFMDPKIVYDKDKKHLIVGNRLLSGEVVKLPLPIALLVDDPKSKKGLRIKNIYHQKVVFDKYPKLLETS